jgi:peptidoglycan-associated lipoprotein
MDAGGYKRESQFWLFGINQKNSGGKGSMRKKMIAGFIVLAFGFGSLLLMASCATQEAQVPEAMEPSTTEMEQKAVPEEEGATMEAAEAKAAEEARRARLQELEESKKMADEVRKFESENIYFDFDKSVLKPEAKVVLKKKGDWLGKNPSYSIRVEGNCDERGTNEYNLALGERRAHSAKKFLMALGISGDRISTISYGEERPAVLGHNEEAWAKNRRDEFKLIK